MEKQLQVFCQAFADLTVSDLRKIMSGDAVMNCEQEYEIQCLAGLNEEIKTWLGSEPQYANFYHFFDKLHAKRMPFKHAFTAAQVFCESRGYKVPLRYQVRCHIRAGKQ